MTGWREHVHADRDGFVLKERAKACAAYCAGFATSAAGFFLRLFRRSSNFCSTVKKEGTKSTARRVDAIMPVKTLMPSDLRAFADAPVARTSGNTPRMKAKEVMRIGRKREREAATAASRMESSPLTRPSRAISTIKMPFLAESAISNIRPICV